MEESTELLSNLKGSLPKEFSFYHLGQVEMQSARELETQNSELALDELNAVAYSFQGDFRGVLIVLVEKGLDVSIYSEMGNILASRMATDLNQGGLDVMISPPRLLETEQLEKLMKTSLKKIQGKYLHRYQNTTVPIEVLLILYPTETRGYA